MKELEQQLQSLEAQKLALERQLQLQQRSDTAAERDAAQPPPGRDDPASTGNSGDAAARIEGSAPEPQPPPFARFFRYPQYAWRHAAAREDAVVAVGAGAEKEASRASAVADVEVGVVVDAHASLRVMAPRRPGQLLRMVAGMQALGLAVLHLNVATALDATALYTFSLKVPTHGDTHTFLPLMSIGSNGLLLLSVHVPTVAVKASLSPIIMTKSSAFFFHQNLSGTALQLRLLD